MDIAGLGVGQFAQDALSDDVHDEHLRLAVAAVLQHHAVALRPLGCVHQVPTLLERDGRGHLDRGVLAAVHGAHGHRRVPLPRRGNVHQVHVIALAEVLEVVLVLEIANGGGPALGRHVGLGGRSALRHDVANGGDRHAVDPQQFAQEACAPSAHADHRHADLVQRRVLQAERALLPARTGWRAIFGSAGHVGSQHRRAAGTNRLHHFPPRDYIVLRYDHGRKLLSKIFLPTDERGSDRSAAEEDGNQTRIGLSVRDRDD